MRRLFIIALIALLFGVALVAIIEVDPGYVLVTYGNYTLETSLWVGLLLLLLLGLSVYLLLRLVYRISGGQRSLFSWLGARKARNALRLSTRGLISFTEGNWLTARRQLLRGAQNNEAPLLNYLLAARASAQMHDMELVHEYLRAATETQPDAAVAVAVALAELKLQAGEYQQAVVALEPAMHNLNRHPYVLSLLRQAYQGLQDWDKLLALLPQLQKHKQLTVEEFENLQRQVHHQRVARSGCDAAQLRAAWHEVPRHLQRETALLEAYVSNLIRLGDHDTAATILQKALQQEWSAVLVRHYGLVQSSDPARQLARAESWLMAHPQEFQLLLCLGRLSARAKLWGKARDYFESSYRLLRSSEICAELGRLLVALGEPQVAAAYFREGLLLREDALPALPLPDKLVPDSRLLVKL